MGDQVALPTGTVTFLFTDVEGSTRLWEEVPAAAGAAMERHDQIIEHAVQTHDGSVVRPRGEGDSRFCVFDRPTDAVAAALAIQQALAKEPWDLPRPVKVRIGINTGEAALRAGDYYGAAVNRCARLRGLGYGGQTLISAVTEDLVAHGLPDGATLQDLGPHRLRDVSEPERVYQLCHPDLPVEFGPLRSVDAVRNNLPIELTSFVGREHEVSTVKKLVGDSRLVTLQGAAGCGKTRLALEVADELIGTFPDGEWFVELAPLNDPAMIEDVVATAVGVHEGDLKREREGSVTSADLRERLIEHLRPKQLLLVLDNCEHLIGPVASLAEELLRRCPSIHILATSREVLGIDPELAWRVPSLSVPGEGEASLDALSRSESFRLFVDRARQRRPDFEVGPADAPAIAEICRRLDGIPLAIELAAARIKLLTPRQIAARLNDFFRLLVGGSRTALERQQTLRAAVDWSFETLIEAERTLFRRLSVFAGGFSLEAIEGVCADEVLSEFEILDVLQSLVDKSLVEVDVRAGRTRYRMLETFRQYAREKLRDAGEGATVRERHRGHFLEVAEQAASSLFGPRQAIWFERLEVEHDNLRAALEWSVADTDSDAAVRLAAALWPFWRARGHYSEGRAWFEQLPPASADLDPTTASCAAYGAAAMAGGQGDLAAAEQASRRAVEVARAADARRWLAIALAGLSEVCLFRGQGRDYGLLDEAEEVARGADDPFAIAHVLSARATFCSTKGDGAGAREALERALGYARRAGDPSLLAAISLELGGTFEWGGDIARAREMAQAALETGAVQTQAWALYDLTEFAIVDGDYDEADALIARGVELQEAHGLGLPWGVLRASIARRTGNLDEARDHYERQIVEGAARGALSSVTMSQSGLASIARQEGDPARALELLQRALRTVRDAGFRPPQGPLIGVIGGCLLDLGRTEEAARCLAASEVWAQRIWAKTRLADQQRAADIDAVRRAIGDERYDQIARECADVDLREAADAALEA